MNYNNRVKASRVVLQNTLRQVRPYLVVGEYHQMAVALNKNQIPYPGHTRHTSGWTEKRVGKFLLTVGLARNVRRPVLIKQRKIATLLVALKTVLVWANEDGPANMKWLQEFPRDQIERAISEAETFKFKRKNG